MPNVVMIDLGSILASALLCILLIICIIWLVLRRPPKYTPYLPPLGSHETNPFTPQDNDDLQS